MQKIDFKKLLGFGTLGVAVNTIPAMNIFAGFRFMTHLLTQA